MLKRRLNDEFIFFLYQELVQKHNRTGRMKIPQIHLKYLCRLEVSIIEINHWLRIRYILLQFMSCSSTRENLNITITPGLNEVMLSLYRSDLYKWNLRCLLLSDKISSFERRVIEIFKLLLWNYLLDTLYNHLKLVIIREK